MLPEGIHQTMHITVFVVPKDSRGVLFMLSGIYDWMNGCLFLFSEILLLDEPTSGLDSFTARHLVSTLVELAHKRGKLVLMTVHQPSTDIVNMLDKICILTGGQLAYLGPPSHMTSHFTNIGYPCPKNLNPCDVYSKEEKFRKSFFLISELGRYWRKC